jgi:hypothetical protein
MVLPVILQSTAALTAYVSPLLVSVIVDYVMEVSERKEMSTENSTESWLFSSLTEISADANMTLSSPEPVRQIIF